MHKFNPSNMINSIDGGTNYLGKIVKRIKIYFLKVEFGLLEDKYQKFRTSLKIALNFTLIFDSGSLTRIRGMHGRCFTAG